MAHEVAAHVVAGAADATHVLMGQFAIFSAKRLAAFASVIPHGHGNVAEDAKFSVVVCL
jgi:hypothetical protein